MPESQKLSELMIWDAIVPRSGTDDPDRKNGGPFPVPCICDLNSSLSHNIFNVTGTPLTLSVLLSPLYGGCYRKGIRHRILSCRFFFLLHMKVSHEDECSTTHAAAQTLLDMGDEYSKKNPCAAVKLLKMPSQMAIKTSQSKATDLSEFSFQEPKSTLKSKNPLKVHDDESSSKKPKLSTDVISTNISHAEPATMRKGTLDQCSLLSVKSPPRKLYRDPNANSESYGVNLVKKPCVIKTPRDADRPSSSKPRFWKSSR